MNVLDFSLEDWLHYLENAHQQEIQLGLTRIKTVAARLDLLQCDATVITVTGTNGKGSTVAALNAIYTSAGYAVAAYTSPHLIRFNERMMVNNQFISDEQLCEAFRLIESARADILLTYFEMTTLAALWYFKQFKLDVIILEVGLGGRLDATNIIDADLAIMTTVALDHQAYLGDTTEAIGYEKAGIFRSNRPCIYADENPPMSVLTHAKTLEAPLYCLGKHYSWSMSEKHFCLHAPTLLNDTLKLPRASIHPNATAAALMASLCLQTRLPLSFTSFEKAMKTVSMVARQQVVGGAIKTVFDVAHNPQAVTLLAAFIQQYPVTAKVHAVFSGLQDKDLSGLIKPMLDCVDHWYPAVLSGKRAASLSLIQRAFTEAMGEIPVCFPDPVAAYQTAQKQATPGDLIVVYGSFLTVRAIMVGCM